MTAITPPLPPEREPGLEHGQKVAIARSLVLLYRALWRYAKGHRASLLSAAFLLLCAELMRLSLPWLAGSAVNVLQAEGRQGLHAAAVLLAQLFGVVLLAWIFHGRGRVLERNVALSVRHTFALELMQGLLHAPLAWHRKEHPVALSQRAMQGTVALHDFAESQWIYLQGSVQILGPLVALYIISPWVGVMGIVGVCLLVTVSLLFDRAQLHLTDAKNAADRHNAATWSDVFTQFLTVQALRLHRGVIAMADSRLLGIFAPLRRLVLVNEIKWGAMDILGTLLWISLVVVHVWQVSSGSHRPITFGSAAGALLGGIALGSVFMVYEYARKVESSMNMMASDFSMLAGQLSGFRAVQCLLQAPQLDDATLQPTAWQQLVLHDLSFQFPLTYADDTTKVTETTKTVLRGINLQLCRQSRYALVGSSGSGKTTLLSMLAGLENPSAGYLCLDGGVVSSPQLRREATLVPNQPAVFEGSVHANVQLGANEFLTTDSVAAKELRGATDTASMWQALERVGLHDFVLALPQSHHTLVGEGVARWSTGEQQRLALARGVLAATGSSMLLLDEPTSNLDPRIAQQVLGNVLEQFSSACVVVALHDFDLLPHFDQIIVMHEGRVVDAGELATVKARCAVLQELMAQPALLGAF